MRSVLVVIITMILTSIGLLIWKSSDKKTYVVQRVIDGDTMIIDNNQEIRLASVNAPENGYCGAEVAKKRLEELVLNKNIELKGEINDKFGRLLVSVYVNGQLVNEIMAKEGLARYTSQMSEGRDRIRTAASESREKEVGIYSLCIEKTNSNNQNCIIKGNNREGKKIFVLPGCKGYTNTDIEKDLGDEWFCTEKEAGESGYVKALNCE